jgi:hypothetical protein
MPSAQYYIDQARTLLSWALVTKDKAYALALRRRADTLLARASSAKPAVADLNPLLADFNESQMRNRERGEGRGS